MALFPSLKIIDPAKPYQGITKHLADCVILNSDGQLYLQRRPEGWSNAGSITLFGGHVEPGETPINAVMREIQEETGGIISQNDITFIATITEDWTEHSEAVHIYFWHDRDGTITGCYECEPVTFSTPDDVLNQENVMEYARYAITECRTRGLIP